MTKPSARTLARRAALQALYQWQVTQQPTVEIEVQFLTGGRMRRADIPYFKDLLHNIPVHVAELDQMLGPLLDRPVRQLDPVTRAILRMGTFELRYRRDIPWRVVIDEAVELARFFGAEQSHRYVNGILDKLARAVRAEESSRGPRAPATSGGGED
ncbi:MAG: transcription antitermination factor NusB [Gammaproteobacteria bacterium]|nr:transcription antitermination factor NusB [Gammaproteobacteria bacterium]NIR82343.1 transcription antitermination factor NusB [Gammaproteobacteria bacterium]NIR91842.1 transcription antitermination factor NusB [Gammaproteobacteria bacterium]NIU03493.1 transcription antitermination factor NusB [Gammaproteobacteria bacterium]NIV76895.1 transcription antitermination factor NusB [Gammaproteobacteria bacterium]